MRRSPNKASLRQYKTKEAHIGIAAVSYIYGSVNAVWPWQAGPKKTHAPAQRAERYGRPLWNNAL